MINVTYITPRGTTYVFRSPVDRGAELLRNLWKTMANEKLDFTSYDAANVASLVRQQIKESIHGGTPIAKQLSSRF